MPSLRNGASLSKSSLLWNGVWGRRKGKCAREICFTDLCFSVLYEKISEEEGEFQKPCQKPSATFQNKKCVWLFQPKPGRTHRFM